MLVSEAVKAAQACPTLCGPVDSTVRGILQTGHWSGQPFPAAGALPNPGSNPALPHCRWILYQLSHQEAYPFSSGSSQPRNQIMVSCIAGGFFTN